MLDCMTVLTLCILTIVGPVGCTGTEAKVEEPPSPNEVVLTRSQDSKGKLLAYVVSNDAVRATSAWDGSTGGPPLSMAKTINLATDYLMRKHPDRLKFRPTYIALQRLWLAQNGEYYWFYSLQMSPGVRVGAADTPKTESYLVVVLMDGSIVEPRAE